MKKITIIFTLFLLIVSFSKEALACYVYFEPGRPAYKSQFKAILVNGVPNRQYEFSGCNSDTPILSGIGCGLAAPIINWLQPAITDDKGIKKMDLNSNSFGALFGQQYQPKSFYVSFTLKNGDTVIDSCRGKVAFVPTADAKVDDKFLKQNCGGGHGVDTAIGCVPTDNLQEFLKFVLKYAFFASGGIIAMLIISTGYTLMTSQGNPEKLQAAKENIVALFSGLVLIAFSLTLLQIIGADILNLPSFR